MLDPSSPWGYERKHAALHGAERYHDAIGTFEMMLLKISQSADPDVRGECIDITGVYLLILSLRASSRICKSGTDKGGDSRIH
jgi:hypothetical protein